MNIRVFKISSGEELVADFVETEETVVLKKPAHIILSPGPKGLNINMIPFMPFIKNHTIELNKADIVTIGFPADDLYNAYNELYGSGIVTPPKKLALPN